MYLCSSNIPASNNSKNNLFLADKYARRVSAAYLLNRDFYNINLATRKCESIVQWGSGNTFSLDKIATNGSGCFDFPIGNVSTQGFTIVLSCLYKGGVAVASMMSRSASVWTGIYLLGNDHFYSTNNNSFDGEVTLPYGPDRGLGFYTIAISYQVDNLKGSLNGGPILSDSSAQQITESYLSSLALGGSLRGTGLDNTAAAEYRFLAVLQGASTDNELIELSTNPYSIFKPRTRKVFHSPAGNSVDLAGFSSSVTVATGGATSDIAIVGGVVSVVSTSGAISQKINIVGSSASVSIGNGLITMVVTLLGNGFAQTVSSGALDHALPLTGAAQVVADGTGDFLAGAPSSLAGSAAIASAGAGQINLTVTLSGAAAIRSLVAADINSSSALSGGAQDAVNAAAVLVSSIPVAGSAQATVSGGAGLSSASTLSGAGAANLHAAGNLDPGSGMTGDAYVIVSGAGALISSIPITGFAHASVTSSTGLSSTILLSGSAVTINNGTGDITVGVGGLTGAAIINALAGGNIALSVSVSAAALARALSAAALVVSSDYVLPDGFYEVGSRTPVYAIRSLHAH